MSRRYVVLGLTSILALALAVPALGGPSNPVADGAASAKKIAKQAKKKAKKANQNAKAAQASADAAQATADGATTAAAGAQSTADGAQTAAEAAQASADAAQATADAAQATANSAYNDTDFEQGPTTGPTSSAQQNASAGCISGYDATGGGFIIGGTGDNDVTPTLNGQYLNGWLVSAQEIGGGTADTWSLSASVTCVGTI